MKFLSRISKGMGVARRLGPHLDGQRGPLVIAGGLSLAAVALEVLRPWPLKWIFDSALVPTAEPTYEASFVIWVGAAAALAIALARTAFQYFATMKLTAVGHSVTRSLRLQLFGHLAELDPGFHAEHKSGDLLVRLMGDVPMVRTLLVESRVALITRALLAVVTVAVMIWLDPLMTLLVVALLPVVFAIVRLLARSIAVAVRKQRKKEGALADFLQESLLATDVIQSLGGTDQTVRRFARGSRTSARAEMKAARAAARLTAFVESSIGLATAGTLVLGALRVADGHLTPGELLVFLSYVRSLSKPSRTTAKQMIKVAKGTACGERILSILEGHQGIRASSGHIMAPEQPNSIAFEGVTYTYESGTEPAVSGLDLTLERGSMTALFGESGAGKSTVTRLALRLFDPELGRVLMDGRDLRELDVDSVRARFALSMQDTVLFGDSVRENLLLGSPEKSDAEVLEALEAAGARSFVEALPEGLDSVLGALGAGLSGGEQRRLCLARALLRQSPILVVDEPFAGLDERAAAKLETTLRAHASEHIVLVVTHDVARLARFDRVAYIDGGRLRDVGTHSELLERNPSYGHVCNLLTESTP